MSEKIFFIDLTEEFGKDFIKEDYFQIPIETHKLNIFRYSLKDWEKEKGAEDCCQKINERIDYFSDILQDYDMIVFVDYHALRSFQEYNDRQPYKIEQGDEFFSSENKEAILREIAERLLYLYINDTFINKLGNRKPDRVLMVYLKDGDTERYDLRERQDKEDKTGEIYRKTYLMNLLGFDKEEMKKLAAGVLKYQVVDRSEKSIEEEELQKQDDGEIWEKLDIAVKAFKKEYFSDSSRKGELISGLFDRLFKDKIDEILRNELLRKDEVSKESVALEGLYKAFSHRIFETEKETSFQKATYYETDFYVTKKYSSSKDKGLERKMQMTLFLYDCLYNGVVEEGSQRGKKIALIEDSAKEHLYYFVKKQKKFYQTALLDLEKTVWSSADIPDLGILDAEKYKLADSQIIHTDEICLDEEKKNPDPLIGRQEDLLCNKKSLDFVSWSEGKDETSLTARMKKIASEKGVKSILEEVRLKNNRIAEIVRGELSIIFSRYLQHSKTNDCIKKEPIFLRPKTHTNEEIYSQENEYRYFVKEGKDTGNPHLGSHNLEQLIMEADRYYESAVIDYLKHSDRKGILIMDSDSEWKDLVYAAREYENYRGKVVPATAISSVGAVAANAAVTAAQAESFAAGIPYSIIPFVLTMGAIPVIAAGTALVTTKKRKKEFEELKEEYVDAVKKSNEQNLQALSYYDRVLFFDYPRIRDVYIYRNDILYRRELLAIWSKKADHHRKKIHMMYDTMRMLEEEFEVGNRDFGSTYAEEKELPECSVDFSVPYCSGERNCRVYSFFREEDVEELKRCAKKEKEDE